MCSWWNSGSQNDPGICNGALAEATGSKRCLLYLVGLETKEVISRSKRIKGYKGGVKIIYSP